MKVLLRAVAVLPIVFAVSTDLSAQHRLVMSPVVDREPVARVAKAPEPQHTMPVSVSTAGTQADVANSGSTSLQSLLKVNGKALDGAGQAIPGTVGVTLSIYGQQTGGAPLWMESQTATADEQGQFSVLLGAKSPTGVPASLFAGSEPRWLGILVHTPGVVEQPRVLLVSVPYAVKATDADTLGGTPASQYMTRAQAQELIRTESTFNIGRIGVPNLRCNLVEGVTQAGPVSGTPNSVARFDETGTKLANSTLYDNGNIGVGTTTPTKNLSFDGATNKTFGVDPNATATAPGSDLAISAGSANASSTDQHGGNLVLQAGVGTGVGGGGNIALRAAGDAASGSTAGTVTDRYLVVGKPKAMTGSVPAAALFSIHIPDGEAAGGKIHFTIVATDGKNYSMETGDLIYIASPLQVACQAVQTQYSTVPPQYTNTVLASPAVGTSGFLNAQCLANWTLSGDALITIHDTAPTSFTATTHKVYFSVENQSGATITLQ